MSFNRLIYDGCQYNKNLKEQQGTFNYIMNKEKYNLPAHLQARHNITGILQNNPVGVYDRPHGHLVDIENDLQGLNRTLSRCPSHKYNPNHQCSTGNSNCHLNQRPGSCLDCIKHKDTHQNTNKIIDYHKKVSFKTCTSDKCF